MFSTIVNMDGGICSQMQQYLMGEVLKRRGHKVLFDLSFFDYGKDINGKDARNFDLLKAFPQLPFRSAPRWKKRIYRKFFAHLGHYPAVKEENWPHLCAPLYLGGYYQDNAEMYMDYRQTFRIDPSVLDATNRAIYDTIPENAVAIHVRRGDLSVYTEEYGEPASIAYFQKAINLFEENVRPQKYYIFSDGMDYVQKELLPVLHNSLNYQLVNNDAAHGYYDLILMTRCRHHICSKGSLAKFAACLADSQGMVITIKDDPQLGPLGFSNRKIISL